MSVKRVFRIVRQLIALAVCAAAGLLAFSVISGNWELLPVLSGSMQPWMPTGSLAIIQREPLRDLRLHDVAVFHPPYSPRVIYMHRVVELRRAGSVLLVRTKGDANPVSDPWTLRISGRSAYIVRYRVPELGYVALWVHSETGRATILSVAGLLALALVISAVREARRKGHEPCPDPGDEAPFPAESYENDLVIDLTESDSDLEPAKDPKSMVEP